MTEKTITAPSAGAPDSKPCLSDSEERRLASLESYGVLDTVEEADFDDIVELISIICEAPIAVINFIDRDRQWFKSVKGLGVRETPLDISICAHAILQPDLFIVEDTREDPRFANNPLVTQDPYLRFYAGALLTDKDGLPLGTLCVLDHKPRDLNANQRFALQTLANQVMTQLEFRRSLREQQALIEKLDAVRKDLVITAATDSLTGMLNRGSFEQLLEREAIRIQQGAPPAVLMLIDLDFFKEINDQFGHHVGDRALTGFADVCRDVFRQSDILARWGGEEFVVFMPRTTLHDALLAAERLRTALRQNDLIAVDSAPGAITFSAGLCTFNGKQSPAEAMQRADELLYQAKQDGRDRIVCESFPG